MDLTLIRFRASGVPISRNSHLMIKNASNIRYTILKHTLEETSPGCAPSVKSHADFFFAELLGATLDLAFFRNLYPVLPGGVLLQSIRASFGPLQKRKRILGLSAQL